MTAFMRAIELHVGSKIFNGDDFEIQFDVPFDDDSETNEVKIDIYNLSDGTINGFKKGTKVVLNAGYKDSYGTIMIGTISKKETDDSEADHVTTLHVIDSSDVWAGKAITKSYKKNIKASQIIKDLSGLVKLPLVMKLPKDVTYPRGFSANGKYVDVIKQVAKDCGAIAYTNKQKMYVRSAKEGDAARFILNSDTRMIGSPEYFEEEKVSGYKVKCLLNQHISVASIVQLDAVKVKGSYRVRKGRHYCNGSDFYTEMEVVGV